MRLNLGACDRREPGFISVDICQPADFVWDLNVTPWPWDDGSIEEIKAWDVCEHLYSRIAFMGECWRILKPGGKLHITTPNAAKGGGYFQDSTHVSPYTINTFKYFCVRPDGSDCLERARFQFLYPVAAKYAGPMARFKPLWIRESHYQDSAINPQCAVPDPVYKLDVMLECVK